MIAQGRNCMKTTNRVLSNPFLFQLKPIKKDLKPRLHAKVDFTPQSTPLSDHFDQFAKDALPADYLPEIITGNQPQVTAFCSSRDVVGLKLENQAFFQRLKDKNSLENLDQKLIMIPKPKSNCCHVCQQTFTDYLQHIEHPNHKKHMLQQSKSSKMITDLIEGLQYKNKRSRSEKLFRSTDLDEDEIKIESISKIRVIQDQNTLTPIRIEKVKCEQSTHCSANSFNTNSSSLLNNVSKMGTQPIFNKSILLLP